MFTVNGLLLTALAVPLIQGRIPRNGWYGFRVPKTLSSDEVWYPANRFMGQELLRCGLVLTVGSLALTVVAGNLSVDAVAYTGLALTAAPLSLAIYRGLHYLRTL